MYHTRKGTSYVTDLHNYSVILRYLFIYFNGNFYRNFSFLIFNSRERPRHGVRVVKQNLV